MDEAFRLAMSLHRGPVFLDISLEAIYGEASADVAVAEPRARPPDAADVERIAALLRTARRPVLVLGPTCGSAAPRTPPGRRRRRCGCR